MLEPPEVYVVESTDELISQMKNLQDLLEDEEQELTPKGKSVTESFTYELQNKDIAEIHKFGLQHIIVSAEKYDLHNLVDVLESTEPKSWSEDEKQRFQDILSST